MTTVHDGNGSGGLALVLSGGGARAAYQIGVLQAIAEVAPELDIPILTGVSAGAINTMYLGAHPGPLSVAVDNLRGEWLRLTPDQVYSVPPARLGRSIAKWGVNFLLQRRQSSPSLHGVMDMHPLRRFLERCVEFDGIRENLRAGRLRAIALSTTCYTNGHTVTFVEGAENVPMWHRHMRYAVRDELSLDHLMGSAAIPLMFPAVKIGNAFYGDGGVRQSAPLAPAIHLGAKKILAIAMRARGVAAAKVPVATLDYPTAAEVLGLLLHSVFLDSLDADAERLVRINQLLHRQTDGHESGLRPVELLVLRPSRDVSALAEGKALKLPFTVRTVLRSIGGERARSAGFLSYLLFEPEYTGRLMDLGFEDGRQQREKIEKFLED
ncbi:MAG: patatin-like phospholipase family protein [Gemmatimonadales bacterium]